MKQPAQASEISQDDQNRINKFKELLLESGAENLRNVLIHVHFDFTQLLMEKPTSILTHTPGNLYYLQMLIEILNPLD